MAKARAIAGRLKAVGNIKKITHTMQLIATARFRKSLNKAVSTKPYTEKITELVRQVSAAGGEIEHPLLRKNTETTQQAVLLLTSNRGLCGGYNAGILRAVMALINANEKDNIETDLYVIGKKGVNYFKFLNRTMHRTYPDMADAPSFDEIEPIATGFMDSYAGGEYASVKVVYMKFITASRQTPEVIQLLPIESEESESGAATKSSVQYEFLPEPRALLAELLPATVKVRLLQCVNDAVVSENVASKSPPAMPSPEGIVPENSPSSALASRSMMIEAPEPKSCIR